MSAGYSGKSLVAKLGIKQGQKIAILNAPKGYRVLLGELPDSVIVAHELEGEFDLIQIFSKDMVTLERELRRSKEKIKQDGTIWIAWPKRLSKVLTNLGESAVREMGLENGLVDVKICAIDETWSALKFVGRVKDRR